MIKALKSPRPEAHRVFYLKGRTVATVSVNLKFKDSYFFGSVIDFLAFYLIELPRHTYTHTQSLQHKLETNQQERRDWGKTTHQAQGRKTSLVLLVSIPLEDLLCLSIPVLVTRWVLKCPVPDGKFGLHG